MSSSLPLPSAGSAEPHDRSQQRLAPRAPRRARRLLVGLCAAFVLAEVAAFGLGQVLRSKWAMYRDPEPVGELSYAEYLELRHPRLGWPYAHERGGPAYAADGSRPSPANAARGDRAPFVALYGDSYTHAAHVDDAQAWGNQLAELIDRPVQNFGVSGYGTDQAYLRYQLQEDHTAEVVILGHMSENILRNLTRYRDFTNFARYYAFKPRFVLDESGALREVPLPTLDEAGYERFLGVASPQLVLEHELFHPGGPSGATRLRFPFSWSLLKNASFYRLQAELRDEPVWNAFYAPDHPFGGLAVTRQIGIAFDQLAQQREQQALIVLFPGQADVEHFRERHVWPYQPLTEALDAAGLAVLDFGDALLAHLAGRPASAAYAQHHYTPEVNAVVAQAVADWLQRP